MKTRHLILASVLVLTGVLIGAIVVALIIPRGNSARNDGRVVQSIRVGSPEVEIPASFSYAASLSSSFKEVATVVRPAVVSVYAGRRMRRDRMPADRYHFFEDRGRYYHGTSGSGVIVSSDGYIVTNNHVISQAEDILVRLTDKREFSATVVGRDPTTDLAVVKILGVDDLPVITLGDSDDIEVGDWAIAVGNPFRLTSTVTAGIISALGRQVNIIEDDFRIEDFIQTDAAINPGNSGGALVNLSGQLIGINTAIATQDGAYEGYGFAVPVNLVAHIVGDLIAYGEVRRAYLGIYMVDVDASRAEELELEEISGVLVDRVVRGGAADRSGVRRDDIILAINGEPVAATNQLQSRIATHRPGETVDLDVWRRGRLRSIRVSLVDREDQAMQNWIAQLNDDEEEDRDEREPNELPDTQLEEAADWGIGIRDLTDADRRDFDTEEGAYIAFVRGGSVAHDGGLPRDAVVTEINGTAVSNQKEMLDALDSESEMAQRERGREGPAGSARTVLIRVKKRDGFVAFYDLAIPLGSR